MAKSNANSPAAIPVVLGTRAATATVPALSLARNFILLAVSYLDGAGIAADNSNYLLLSLQKGATVVATLDTRAGAQGAVTALVAKTCVLDAGVIAGLVAAGVPNEIPAGDYKLVATKNGTGVPTDGVLMLHGYYK